jgi:melibiose permease/lactose/raffinose/galactose permease
MGVIVDNTRSRIGKYKPWIAIGAVTSALFTVLLFTDFGLTGAGFVALFAVVYLFWGMSYTAHDISYWSMLPSLSSDQKEREKIGAVARICANVGLFFVVAGIIPLTELLGSMFGSLTTGWFVFALSVSVIMVAGLCVTFFLVKETKQEIKQSTPLRELLNIIFKNDQLSFTALSMSLFQIGYLTTTTFGIYFFKYAYGDEGMYSTFALVLGLSQIAALVVFPLISKRLERGPFFTMAMILVAVGYVVFFFAPMNMIPIGVAGVLIFVGQSFIQLLMLMFLADSVDYGHWKLGKRNDSVSFSLQPFINKSGGAIASGVVSLVLILSGINEAETAAEVTSGGLLMMKIAMLVFPMVCIIVCYIIYKRKYKIDRAFYEKIQADLKERGELT